MPWLLRAVELLANKLQPENPAISLNIALSKTMRKIDHMIEH